LRAQLQPKLFPPTTGQLIFRPATRLEQAVVRGPVRSGAAVPGPGGAGGE